tara:strand:- start:635 stop:799 length:165 start_codon:yes stop_codon:yes gene_type:complete
MKGVKHYKKDGSIHKGDSHKMSNDVLHTGKKHTKKSEKLFHENEYKSLYGDMLE